MLIPPQGAGLAIREMKRAMHEPQVEALSRALDQENQALGKLFASADFSEGISARVERRTPVFKGIYMYTLDHNEVVPNVAENRINQGGWWTAQILPYIKIPACSCALATNDQCGNSSNLIRSP